MNESGSLVWAVKKARERPKCNVVRHVSGKKASWYPWREARELLKETSGE